MEALWSEKEGEIWWNCGKMLTFVVENAIGSSASVA